MYDRRVKHVSPRTAALGRRLFRLAAVAAAVVLPAAGVRAIGLTPVELRCEDLADPLGIDEPAPRLSWKLQAEGRGQMQSAYHLVVVGDTGDPAARAAVVWDTGRVESDQSRNVAYAGAPLEPLARYAWRVRVWDQTGEPSPWSQSGRWSMGLPAEADWTAAWIGLDETPPARTNPLEGASWIWHPEPDTGGDVPTGTRYFRRRITVPADRTLTAATAMIAADNRYRLWCNGVETGRGDSFKLAQTADLLPALQPGRNTLALEVTNLGDAPNPAGLLGVITLQFDQGEPIRIVTDAAWRATDSTETGWQRPDHADTAWREARVLAPVGEGPWGDVAAGDDAPVLPARLLRHEFPVPGPVLRATVCVSGLGYSELYVNGRRVGDHVLDPVLMDYDKRVPYVTHDITGHLLVGRNAIGVMLGNGRYFAPRRTVPMETKHYGYPKLRLQARIELADGTVRTVQSDESWRITTEGPIRENNDYDGEIYDARMGLPGWAEPGFADGGWLAAEHVPAPTGRMTAQMMPPMRVTETREPVALTEPKPGVWIYDLGQNMVGWCRLRVNGPRGTRVQLRHAETLNADGMLDTANLRSAQCRDVYILAGEGEEFYEPRFTYHGFRYVEVTGYPGTPVRTNLLGRVVHTDLPATGSFSSSNPLLNRIHENVRWGLRGNYLSIPMDCPQRDERQGWQGDRAAESRGETYLFENVTLYRKWLDDIRASQRDDGNLSDVCPPFWALYSPNVTWPSAYVLIPGTLAEQYDDRRAIAAHYPSMKRWMAFLETFVQDGIIDRDNYGDWCVPPEDPALIHSQDPARRTSPALLATSYYAHNLQLLAHYARLLELPEEAEQFEAQAETVREAFNRRFLDPETALYDNGTQTSSVLPLAFGLAPEALRPAIFSNLVDNIATRTDHHIGTGLIGGQWLMRVLSEFGRADLAYRLASNRTYPSWGYMIDQGATTIWELWNGNTADPAMNSGNHVMLVGDLMIWCYEVLAGIQSDPAEPGFRHILMRPHPVEGLDFVQARYESVRGPIESHWRRVNGAFLWDVSIPPNCTATLSIPVPEDAAVTERGMAVTGAPGVRTGNVENNRLTVHIGSGEYAFAVRSNVPAESESGAGAGAGAESASGSK
jgi:alpha-L-rhamnosidase